MIIGTLGVVFRFVCVSSFALMGCASLSGLDQLDVVDDAGSSTPDATNADGAGGPDTSADACLPMELDCTIARSAESIEMTVTSSLVGLGGVGPSSARIVLRALRTASRMASALGHRSFWS